MWKCNNCNAKYPKPSAKCFKCNEWNTVIEDDEVKGSSKKSAKVITKIAGAEAQKILNNQIKEFERVLVLHTKSVVLIGGEPGIGKSTLMCQLACKIDGQCMYLCGEESSETVQKRIERVNQKFPSNLNVVDFCSLRI